MTTADFKVEAYSQGTPQAYLTLLTVNHADLSVPLRFTSDGVATLSNGDTYTPLAMRAILPDRSQGRQPEATIRIDNVNKSLLEVLRSLQTAPTVTMAIIRASDPDTIEEEYADMKITGMEQPSAAFIDFTLALEDLASEPFPPRTFDQSWGGVYQS